VSSALCTVRGQTWTRSATVWSEGRALAPVSWSAKEASTWAILAKVGRLLTRWPSIERGISRCDKALLARRGAGVLFLVFKIAFPTSFGMVVGPSRISGLRGAFCLVEFEVRNSRCHFRRFALVMMSRISAAPRIRCLGSNGVHPSMNAFSRSGADIPCSTHATVKASLVAFGSRNVMVSVGIVYNVPRCEPLFQAVACWYCSDMTLVTSGAGPYRARTPGGAPALPGRDPPAASDWGRPPKGTLDSLIPGIYRGCTRQGRIRHILASLRYSVPPLPFLAVRGSKVGKDVQKGCVRGGRSLSAPFLPSCPPSLSLEGRG